MIKDLDRIKIGGRVVIHGKHKVIKDYYTDKGKINLIFEDGTTTKDEGIRDITFIYSSEEYSNIFRKITNKIISNKE